jgi:hypothetical protein
MVSYFFNPSQWQKTNAKAEDMVKLSNAQNEIPTE